MRTVSWPRSRNGRVSIVSIFLGGLAAGVIAHFSTQFLPFLQLAESTASDLRVAYLTPPMAQARDIVVVAITEDTLARLAYRSPIDRQFLADLLDDVHRKGARFVVLDILLDQATEPDKDEMLRNALTRYADTVVVATADASDGLTPAQVSFQERFLAGIDTGLARVYHDPSNGVVRAVHLAGSEESGGQVGLIARVARRLGTPVPDGLHMALRYRASPDRETQPFRLYPAHAVSLLPDAWLRDQIVLVGAHLVLEDRHRTPYALRDDVPYGWISGVLVHAHALSQLLEGRASGRPGAALELLLAIGCGLIGAVLARTGAGPLAVAILGLVSLAAVWVAAFAAYATTGLMLPVVAPSVSLVGVAALVCAMRWRGEFVQRRFLREAFSRFLAPALVEQLVEDPSRLRLSGERRELSFVFTDLAGYTAATQSMDPSDMVKLVNEYLDGAFEIVQRHGGMVEKIVGDALHVMFNAPLEQPDHPHLAVACALELDRYFERFASLKRSDRLHFGHTRIGVNTGTVVVGNMGGSSRFDYTATGDAVNIAARLESANRYLGTRVCVGAQTVRRCPRLRFRPVAELVLKGLTEPVPVYDPIGADAMDADYERAYSRAYASLASGDVDAGAMFASLAERAPEDRVVAFHRRRIDRGERGVRVALQQA